MQQFTHWLRQDVPLKHRSRRKKPWLTSNKGTPEIIFTSMNILMLKLKLHYFGHLMWRVDSLGEILMLGKIEGRGRRGGQRARWLEWDHWLNGHDFEQALGDGEGQGILECCSPRSHKELGMTERLNTTTVSIGCMYLFQLVSSPVQQAGFWKCGAVGEWEMRHMSSLKGEDQGTNIAPRWGRRNWIHASFIILSAMKERMCGELSYNSCGLQGQRTKWS